MRYNISDDVLINETIEVLTENTSYEALEELIIRLETPSFVLAFLESLEDANEKRANAKPTCICNTWQSCPICSPTKNIHKRLDKCLE